ncbi:MAG: methylated-DNA--[protein]-cysteine S-methyltransferase [Acholeplasmataceae bacterium]|nr:methylated-DNA--[protein]-cysteine S-methyltransferase [Acholeplasmataceae bacterium]
MRTHGSYLSPFGLLSFAMEDGCLVHMTFGDDQINSDDTPEIDFLKDELDRYFKGLLKRFETPVCFNHGTLFQIKVWNALKSIPFGETRSYSEIATMIGSEKALRAVGQACKNNPVGLVVPCHRVIGKDGSMTGYSGKEHVLLKAQLIAFEKRQ